MCISDLWFIDHSTSPDQLWEHDDVIKWKCIPRNWPFVRGIHRSPVNFLHKGQWRVALMFSLICVWMNDWVNNREAGDLRRYRAHYDVIVMIYTARHLSKITLPVPPFCRTYGRNQSKGQYQRPLTISKDLSQPSDKISWSTIRFCRAPGPL